MAATLETMTVNELSGMMTKRALLVVAYGVGLDSTAMIVEMNNRGMRPDLILFADVGAEHPETYAYIPIFNEWLRSVGFPEVTICRFAPTHVTYTNLEDKCLANGAFPSLAYGGSFHSCALVFKRDVQAKFLKSWTPAIEAIAAGYKMIQAIGYDDGAADRKRAAKAGTVHARHQRGIDARADKGKAPLAEQWQTANFDFRFFLQDWGLERGALAAIIEEAGLPVPRKSCCFFCPATTPAEVVELKNDHPDLYWRAVELERNAQAKLTKGPRGMAMGRWYWESLADVTDPALAADHIKSQGFKGLEGLRP